MRTNTYFIFLFLCLGSICNAQMSHLVHLRTQPGLGNFSYHQSDSIYTWRINDPDETVDLTILPNGTPYEISSGYSIAYAVYDYNINPIHCFKIIEGSSYYELNKRVESKYIFSSFPGIQAGSIGGFSSVPELTGEFPNPYFSSSNSLLFNTEEEPQLTMPFHFDWYYPDVFNANPHPIPYFQNATPFYGQVLANAAYVDDGHIITTHNMLDDVVINWADTINFGNNQWGTLWLKINPLTGNYIVAPMLSDNGSVMSLTVFPSENHDFIYRTGTLRGHNLQVSPDGSAWENSPEDSLYHTFIVKENANGEQQWIRELFAYNDTWSDLNPPQVGIFYSERTPSLIELNNNVYLSSFVQISSAVGDTIYYRDVDGTESLHPLPDISDPNFGGIALATKTLYQLDEQGFPISYLRQSLPFHNVNNSSYRHATFDPWLFKIDDILGWSNTYHSIIDTTIYYLKSNLNGVLDSTAVNLPAGKGAYILWLDSELQILGTTNIPFSSPDHSIGISITHASLFNTDTLIISGIMRNGTISSLDPSGMAEDITYPGITNFIGFYTLPSVLSNEDKESSPAVAMNIYPNPGNNVITVKSALLAGANYEVYDLTGKILLRGSLPNSNASSINIENLDSGMYLLKITTNQGQTATEKFIKN